MINLTHAATGLKIRVAPEHITALISVNLMKAVKDQFDSSTKCAVVLSSGTTYHVRQSAAAVEGLMSGLSVVGDTD